MRLLRRESYGLKESSILYINNYGVSIIRCRIIRDRVEQDSKIYEGVQWTERSREKDGEIWHDISSGKKVSPSQDDPRSQSSHRASPPEKPPGCSMLSIDWYVVQVCANTAKTNP